MAEKVSSNMGVASSPFEHPLAAIFGCTPSLIVRAVCFSASHSVKAVQGSAGGEPVHRAATRLPRRGAKQATRGSVLGILQPMRPDSSSSNGTRPAFSGGLRAAVASVADHPLRVAVSLESQAPPEPAPTEVVIQVRSAAVHWVDLMMLTGQYQHIPPLPFTPGLEFAGTVHAVGAEVSGCEPGDRVIADGLKTGPRSLGDYQRWGGWASFSVAPAAATLPLPTLLDFDQAAGLLGAYETAYHALITRAQLRAGESILVHGATGATGLAAVHLAKRLGATVIATGRSEKKLSAVASEGADHVLPIATAEGGVRRFRDDVKQLTKGGVDVVYDGVGGEVGAESLRALRFGGRYLVVGWASTPFAARRGANVRANSLPSNLVLMKGLNILGCPAAIAAHRDLEERDRRVKDILTWAERGELEPRVGAVFALDQVEQAIASKWKSNAVGGIVLRPPEPSLKSQRSEPS